MLNKHGSLYLRVGGQFFGAAANAGTPGTASSGFTPTELFREVSTSGGSAAENGQSVTVYAADLGGLTYTITQTVNYIFPNDFYTVDIQIDVPAGNTQWTCHGFVPLL